MCVTVKHISDFHEIKYIYGSYIVSICAFLEQPNHGQCDIYYSLNYVLYTIMHDEVMIYLYIYTYILSIHKN